MNTDPSIVVFDPNWLDRHQPLLERILIKQTQTKILGFSLFKIDPDQKTACPVTPADKIVDLNPVIFIMDMMISEPGEAPAIKHGTQLFVWIRRQPAFRKIPVIIITDQGINQTDREALSQYGVAGFFTWKDLEQDAMRLKTLVTNILVSHKRKTAP